MHSDSGFSSSGHPRGAILSSRPSSAGGDSPERNKSRNNKQFDINRLIDFIDSASSRPAGIEKSPPSFEEKKLAENVRQRRPPRNSEIDSASANIRRLTTRVAELKHMLQSALSDSQNAHSYSSHDLNEDATPKTNTNQAKAEVVAHLENFRQEDEAMDAYSIKSIASSLSFVRQIDSLVHAHDVPPVQRVEQDIFSSRNLALLRERIADAFQNRAPTETIAT